MSVSHVYKMTMIELLKKRTVERQFLTALHCNCSGFMCVCGCPTGVVGVCYHMSMRSVGVIGGCQWQNWTHWPTNTSYRRII